MATPKKKKAKKAAPKKAAAALNNDPKDYRGYCVTERKAINKRWKTEDEAMAERDAHKKDFPSHDVDIEEKQ